MGDRHTTKPRRSSRSKAIQGERVFLALDGETRHWLTPWTGRGVVERVREVVRDAHSWFGLPAPIAAALEADREQAGSPSQRDYIVSLLLRRGRELGATSAALTSAGKHRQSSGGAAEKSFCCLLEPGTRASLHAGRWLGSRVEDIIFDARTFYGVSPRVRDLLAADMRRVRIGNQRDYLVWLLIQRLWSQPTLTHGTVVGRVA